MNQSTREDAMKMVETLNRVEGFEPSTFVMDLTNLATGEVRKRLPVNAQIAWFRLKYPMGKIAVSVKAGRNESQIATAKVYADVKDSVENYLAEGTVEKFPIKDKPEIAVIEWAQTSAIGLALKNAGFGLQVALDTSPALQFEDDGYSVQPHSDTTDEQSKEQGKGKKQPVSEEEAEQEKVKKALAFKCPLSKYKDKTYEALLKENPIVLDYLAHRWAGKETAPDAAENAKIICDYAKKQAQQKSEEVA